METMVDEVRGCSWTPCWSVESELSQLPRILIVATWGEFALRGVYKIGGASVEFLAERIKPSRAHFFIAQFLLSPTCPRPLLRRHT